MNNDDMLNLIDIIEVALTQAHVPYWLPNVTDTLVDMEWKRLQRHLSITASDYGTERVLAGHIGAPRHIVACLPCHTNAAARWPHILTEELRHHALRRYQNIGLRFYTLEEATEIQAVSLMRQAFGILSYTPALQQCVEMLARSCHLLKPENDDYDVSYSDPEVPFSIFVSIPEYNHDRDVLRVAEAIVHEAMHLHLTLIEKAVTLVQAHGKPYFSPWKGECRSPRGVLHALYVFRVIDQFFEHLLAQPIWAMSHITYMRDRRREIALQIRDIASFQDHVALTPIGARFVRRLMLPDRHRAVDEFHVAKNT